MNTNIFLTLHYNFLVLICTWIIKEENIVINSTSYNKYNNNYKL